MATGTLMHELCSISKGFIRTTANGRTDPPTTYTYSPTHQPLPINLFKIEDQILNMLRLL